MKLTKLKTKKEKLEYRQNVFGGLSMVIKNKVQHVLKKTLSFVLILSVALSSTSILSPQTANAISPGELRQDETYKENCEDVINLTTGVSEDSEKTTDYTADRTSTRRTHCSQAYYATVTMREANNLFWLYTSISVICALGCSLGWFPWGQWAVGSCTVASLGGIAGEIISGVRLSNEAKGIEASYENDIAMKLSSAMGPLMGIISASASGGVTKAFTFSSDAMTKAGNEATSKASDGAYKTTEAAQKAAEGGSEAGKKAAEQGDKAATKEASSGAIASCLQMAGAIVQTVLKKVEADTSKETFYEEIETAGKSIGDSNLDVTSSIDTGTDASAESSETDKSSSSSGSSGSEDDDDETETTMAELEQSAAKYDPSLVPFLESDQFNDAVQKTLGTDLPSLASQPIPAGGAGDILSDLAASTENGTINPDEMRAAYDHLSESLADGSGSSYASSGGVSRGTAGGADPMAGVSDLMSNIMGQFNPNGKKKEKSGTDTLTFGKRMQGRTANQIADDRSIGIFKRISYRYHHNRKKVLRRAWGTQYNRSISGNAP